MYLSFLQDNEEHSYSTLKSKNTSARVSGLKPGTKYIFQVRARTSAGCGRFSQNIEIQTGKAGVCMCVYTGLRGEKKRENAVSLNCLVKSPALHESLETFDTLGKKSPVTTVKRLSPQSQAKQHSMVLGWKGLGDNCPSPPLCSIDLCFLRGSPLSAKLQPTQASNS